MTKSKTIISNLFVAATSVSVLFAIHLLFSTPFSWDFAVIILIMSLAEYFYDRVRDLTRNKHERYVIKTLSLVALVTLPVLVLKYGNRNALLVLVIILLLGIYYPLYFKKLTGKFIGFKDIFVPFSWGLVSIFYLLYFNVQVTGGLICFIFLIFLRDIVNTSFCDLGDMKEDEDQKLMTLANFFGKRKLLMLLQIINVISITIIAIGVYLLNLPSLSVALILPILLTVFFINKAKDTHNFSSFYVDVEYVIWVSVVYVAKAVFF